MIKISKRLEAIGDFVPDGSVLVDIGTDHALLIIYLLESKKIEKAYGLDIAAKPLAIAKENILAHGCSDKVELILSDGLKSFDQKGNAFVVAGMGAKTIWGIIKDYDFKEHDSIILQANSKHAFLRKKLAENYFEITDESFIIDMNRPYTILKVKKGKKLLPLTIEEEFLGPVLIAKNEAHYINKIKERRSYLRKFKKFNADLKQEFDIIDRFLKEHKNESI